MTERAGQRSRGQGRALAAAKAPGKSRPEASGKAKGEHVQALSRALALLNRIAEAADGGASLTELAQQVGLAPSTAHRLLTTLELERFAHFDHDGRLWSIGAQAFAVGCAFTKSRSLVGLARPYMRRLMEESGETVNLAVEDQGQMVYLAQVECRQMMRAFARPGSRVPLHCSAVGKAVLSAGADRSLSKQLLRHGMPRLTVKTITVPAQLRADLERARTLGYAIDDEEHAVGLRCIAAPIFDESGEAVAALSVSGPMARIVDERIAPLSALVVRSARAISAEMGAEVTTDAAPVGRRAPRR